MQVEQQLGPDNNICLFIEMSTIKCDFHRRTFHPFDTKALKAMQNPFPVPSIQEIRKSYSVGAAFERWRSPKLAYSSGTRYFFRFQESTQSIPLTIFLSLRPLCVCSKCRPAHLTYAFDCRKSCTSAPAGCTLYAEVSLQEILIVTETFGFALGLALSTRSRERGRHLR